MLDSLIESVHEGKSELEFPFYRCTLGKHYIKQNSKISCDPYFLSVAVLIQREQFNKRNDLERIACRSLPITEPE